MPYQNTLFGDSQPFGTTVQDIVRHDAVDTSVAAAKRVDTSKWERLCYAHCRSRGIWGVTNAETAQHYVRPVHAISGRWSALIDKGLVFDSGFRRGGARVLVAESYRAAFNRNKVAIAEQLERERMLARPRVTVTA